MKTKQAGAKGKMPDIKVVEPKKKSKAKTGKSAAKSTVSSKKSRSRAQEDAEDAAVVPAAAAEEDETSTKDDNSTEGKRSSVVYLGGIVYGFFEHQIRAFLEQFGPIKQVRLSRNKKTGRSKHYAFVEFADAGTADIAARTMDGYLMMGNILRCRVVDPAAVHPDLWKGANRRFKAVPWSRIAAGALARPATESAWDRRRTKEEARRRRRADKLRELGYEFEGPQLKLAEAPAVPELLEGPAADDGDDGEKTEKKEKKRKGEEEASTATKVIKAAPASKKTKAKK